MADRPVYKLFTGRLNELYYRLSEAERADLNRHDSEAMIAAGGKPIVLCDARWHNERWDFWGVEQFPSVEVIQEYTRRQEEFGWFRYFDSFSALGTPWEGFEATPTATLSVFKLFQVRFQETFLQLADAEREQLSQRVDAARDAVGGRLILLCNSRWHDQRWAAWGLEEFPTVEAEQEHARLIAEFGWHRYHDSVSMLGTAWKG